MSGLVTGLQNRLRRFESARDLKASKVISVLFFIWISFNKVTKYNPQNEMLDKF